MKIYKPRKGYETTVRNQKEAQIVGEALERLTQENKGEITPPKIIETAREPVSPLHPFFDWEDTTAAEKYRLLQARRLMQSVVEVVVVGSKQQEYRSFYNVKNKTGQKVYVTLETALTDKEYVVQLIRESQNHISRLNSTLSLFVDYYRQSKK